MKKVILLGIGVMFIFLSACEKFIIKAPEIEEGVSFSTEVQPIFDATCVTCHSGNLNPDLRPENSYNSLVNGGYVDTNDPENSVIYIKLRGTHDSRASEEEKLTILQWITEGALNN